MSSIINSPPFQLRWRWLSPLPCFVFMATQTFSCAKVIVILRERLQQEDIRKWEKKRRMKTEARMEERKIDGKKNIHIQTNWNDLSVYFDGGNHQVPVLLLFFVMDREREREIKYLYLSFLSIFFSFILSLSSSLIFQ